MKTLSRFRAKSISGSGDIYRGHKKHPLHPAPPPRLTRVKKPRLNRVKKIFGTNWSFVSDMKYIYLVDILKSIIILACVYLS